MAFKRKSMESLVSQMVSWMQGVSTRLTDFRVGSKNLAIIEAVARAIEQLYDKVYRSIRQLITDNIYAVFAFDKVPAAYATGIVTFSRSTAADQNYTILSGTTLLSQASQYSASVKFYTTADSILSIGTLSVDVPVVCAQSGSVGNIGLGTLTIFVQKPLGIEAVTNALAFDTGTEVETNASQKARFQDFFEAQARGILQSIAYGAKLAKLVDPTTGAVTEAVLQSIALEYLPDRKGEVDLYIWNGVGAASSALISAVSTIEAGYYDASGNPVYGYKPAGIMLNIYTALTKAIVIKVIATPETTTTLDLMKPLIEAEISRYFLALTLGQTIPQPEQTVVQSALQANVKRIDGIYDVKLSFSLDSGATFSTDNVTVIEAQIAIVQYPILYT